MAPGVSSQVNLGKLHTACKMFGASISNVGRMARVLEKMRVRLPENNQRFISKCALEIFDMNPIVSTSASLSTPNITTKYGMLSVVNIERILLEDMQDLAFQQGDTGKNKLMLAKKTGKFLTGLLKLKSIRDLWENMAALFTQLDIANGARIYEVRSDESTSEVELHARSNFRLALKSRYDKNWSYVSGEKACIFYVMQVVYRQYKDLDGKAVQKIYSDLLKTLETWHFNGRSWDMFGLSERCLRSAWNDSKEKKKAAAMVSFAVERVTGGSLTDKLKRTLENVVAENMCFSKEAVTRYCDKAYEGFKLENKITADSAEEGALNNEYMTIMHGFMKRLDNAVALVYRDTDRRDVSKKYLSENKMGDLYALVNDHATPEVFRPILEYYCDSLRELENNREALGVKKGQEPEGFYERFYNVIRDQKTMMPVALAFCTNMEGIAARKKGLKMFEGDKLLKEDTIDALAGINNSLAANIEAKLQEEEKNRDNKRAESQRKISEILLKHDTNIHLRLEGVLEEILKAVKQNGEAIESSLSLVANIKNGNGSAIAVANSPELIKTLEIVAATNQTKKGILIEVFNKVESCSNLSAWVVLLKKPISVVHSKIYIDGNEFDINDLPKESRVYGQLKRITDNPNETFICMPLLSGVGDVEGVLSVQGARLGNKEVDMVLSIKNNISLAVQNDLIIKKLKESEITDQVTGLYNRKHFDSIIPIEFERAKREKTPLSMLFIDLDGLKPYDDKDHLAGDYILKCVASSLSELISIKRKQDDRFKAVNLNRYGGDENTVLMPGFTAEEATKFAEELREYVAGRVVKLEAGELTGEHRFTISIGVSQVEQWMLSYAALIKCADDATYWSKRTGKNRVTPFNSDIAGKVAQKKIEEGMKGVR